MKKEYMAPAINVKVILAQQLLAASETTEIVDEEADGQDSKPSFSIWDYIDSKE